MQYTWTYTQRDNGGKFQSIKVKAADKLEAIRKGRAKAQAKAKGDPISWDCRLDPILH